VVGGGFIYLITWGGRRGLLAGMAVGIVSAFSYVSGE